MKSYRTLLPIVTALYTITGLACFFVSVRLNYTLHGVDENEINALLRNFQQTYSILSQSFLISALILIIVIFVQPNDSADIRRKVRQVAGEQLSEYASILPNIGEYTEVRICNDQGVRHSAKTANTAELAPSFEKVSSTEKAPSTEKALSYYDKNSQGGATKERLDSPTDGVVVRHFVIHHHIHNCVDEHNYGLTNETIEQNLSTFDTAVQRQGSPSSLRPSKDDITVVLVMAINIFQGFMNCRNVVYVKPDVGLRDLDDDVLWHMGCMYVISTIEVWLAVLTIIYVVIDTFRTPYGTDTGTDTSTDVAEKNKAFYQCDPCLDV